MRTTMLLLLMVLTSLSAWAQNPVTNGTCGATGNEDNVTWAVTDTDNNGTYEALTISGTGAMADYTDNQMDNETSPWYGYDIESVVIENGVTSIGEYAFYACNGLTSVTIGSDVTTIGKYAFNDCLSLTSVTIPASVTSIGEEAFYNCTSLASVALNGAATIGRDAFTTNANTTVTIADGLNLYNGTEVLSGNVTEMSELNGKTLTTAVTVPVLTVSDATVTDTEALATWTECDGVTEYTIQLACDYQFTTGGGSGKIPILSEDFSGFSGNGTADIGSNGTLDEHTSTDGWTGSKVYTASETAKIGASSGQGWIMTPVLNASGTLTVVWSTYRFGTSDSNTLLLGVSENGTDFDEETITIGDEMTSFTNTFAVSGPTVYVRWMASGSSKARFYLDDITIKAEGSGNGSLIGEYTVTDGTSYTFTGLSPETTYHARVKGSADWSNVEEFTTESAGDSAPVWSASFPATGSVDVGQTYTLTDVSSYVTGTPAPAITMSVPAGLQAEFEDDTFTFCAESSGDYTFTFTAANGVTPDATATLVVTAVAQAPELTASLGTTLSSIVGEDVEFTVTVTGAPAPTINVTCPEGAFFVFENGEFCFDSCAAGTYHFIFTATNSEGSDTMTVTVEVSAAPTSVTLTEETGVSNLTAADIVTFSRSFSAGKAATICLPFPMTSISGGKVYEFRDVTYDAQEGWIATMIDATPPYGNNVTPDGNNITTTVAGRPYLFMPDDNGEVTFSGTVTSVPESVTAGTTTSGDWTFHGTYSPLNYEEESATNPFSGTVFGFAATDGEAVGGGSVTAGQFVKAASGASIVSFRAFLTYTGNDSALQAPSRGAAASTPDIPDRITVRLIGKNGTMTAVGSMDTATGDVTIERWFDMSGRAIQGEPVNPGLYQNTSGKKILISE
ncbi:MAG: leucine-rich repeat protein [Bacteroidaceae bacterium]|nr:leucine-rich repeat protein [Bacteroidaceae bacterium]